MFLSSAWSAISFTLSEPEAGDQPQIDSLMIEAAGGIANPATLTGTASRLGVPEEGIKIQIDLDEDGVADHSVFTNPAGEFEFPLITLQDLTSPIDLKVRVTELDVDTGTEWVGDWQAITYTPPSPTNYVAPAIDTLNLTNNVAGVGVAGDLFFTGSLTVPAGFPGDIFVELDVDFDGVIDQSIRVSDDGSFQFTLPAGSVLEGPNQLNVRSRIEETAGSVAEYSTWQSIGYDYQIAEVSPENLRKIKQGRSPEVDEKWLMHNPQHAGYFGDKLIHHHIDQGRMASGLPETIHIELFDILHRRTLD